jgi:hypothetical protein
VTKLTWALTTANSAVRGINNLGTQVFNLELQLLLIPYQMQVETLPAHVIVTDNTQPYLCPTNF